MTLTATADESSAPSLDQPDISLSVRQTFGG